MHNISKNQSTGSADSILQSCLQTLIEVSHTERTAEFTISLDTSEALKEILHGFQATVRALIRTIEARDPYTAGHSERVMLYSILTGQELGLSADDLRLLGMGALIHDIGKVGVPDYILNKPGKLTPEEFEMVKLHPAIGDRIIDDIPSLAEMRPIVRHHHEKLNGGGYPDGISGGEIPLLVRIVAVADIFDALTSSRSYRGAMTWQKALDILNEEVESGALDPKVVGVFADIIKREGDIPFKHHAA